MLSTPAEIAGMIDHALLNPALMHDELEAGIRLAREWRVASVCIMPCYLRHCAERLASSGVRPSTVIGFPHGAHATAIKRAEALQAIADGGEELDMVVNVSAVRSGDWDCVRADIAAVIEAAHDAGRAIKVIFENGYLNDAQKIALCEICGELGADWVKTATGFGPSGATLDDCRLMRRHSPPPVQIKAAGGIRDLDSVLRYREIGVTRIGTAATAAILEQCRARLA